MNAAGTVATSIRNESHGRLADPGGHCHNRYLIHRIVENFPSFDSVLFGCNIELSPFDQTVVSPGPWRLFLSGQFFVFPLTFDVFPRKSSGNFRTNLSLSRILITGCFLTRACAVWSSVTSSQNTSLHITSTVKTFSSSESPVAVPVIVTTGERRGDAKHVSSVTQQLLTNHV